MYQEFQIESKWSRKKRYFYSQADCKGRVILILQKFEILDMAKMAIYGHLAIGPWVTNSGKWGIPEKSYKNVAQQ